MHVSINVEGSGGFVLIKVNGFSCVRGKGDWIHRRNIRKEEERRKEEICVLQRNHIEKASKKSVR